LLPSAIAELAERNGFARPLGVGTAYATRLLRELKPRIPRDLKDKRM
jgi:hypothetical protein